MVLRLLGRSTSFQTPISVSPSNSSWEAASHLLLSSKFIASQYELGTSWNMFAKIALIISPEGWGWWAKCSFVGRKEYCGVGISGPAGSWPDPEGCAPDGTAGGAMGGFGWVCDWDPVGLNADWPGLGGCGEDGAGMTSSSPDVSDSLSDSEIGGSSVDVRFFIASWAGNRVSLNFTSQEISMRWWAASQNWYPLDPCS